MHTTENEVTDATQARSHLWDLIKDILHANYWDVDESKLVQLFHMAKAVITGKPPTKLGEYAQVRMD